MNKIKLFRLIGGEMVITSVNDVKKDGMYVLSYPSVVIPVPQQQGQIGFGKLVPFSDYDKEILINPNSITIESEPNKQMIEAYESFITQVKAQDSGIIMSNRMPQTLPGNNSRADFSKLNM